MKGFLAVLMLLVSTTAAHADIYTWKDSKGTRFYTNSLHEIPSRYLKKARVLDVATGKLAGLATAQPAPTTAPSRGTGPAPATQPLLVQQSPVGQAPPQSPPQPVPAAQAPPANAPAAAAAPPPATPVAESTPSTQNATRQQGRLSRRELRALGRRSGNSTGEE